MNGSPPNLLSGRYVLTKELAREGGMSIVRKAIDTETSNFCAIKRMKDDRPDELRWKDSFNREYAALSDLSQHANIVTLHEAGQDDDGFYMVLEWVPSSLADLITSRGAIGWDEFYRTIGRPILDALAYAQGRGWSHRDIKPQNILIGENGEPKIADYGIAKQIAKPSLGLTFAHFRSVPFTPPEDDGGEWGLSRDCFSWAAVAVYCLTGIVPTDYGVLSELASGLDHSTIPVQTLLTALSHTPAERPPLASAFLAELDGLQAKLAAASQPRLSLYLKLEGRCTQSILRAIDRSDPKDAETFVLQELNEIHVGVQLASSSLDQRDEIRLFAVTWTFVASRVNGTDIWTVEKAWQSSSGEVERLRDSCYRAALLFNFNVPSDAQFAAEQRRELAFQMQAFEHEKNERARARQKERIFRLWYSFLRNKADFEESRENAISYVDYKSTNNSVTFSTELPVAIEVIGQSRVIRTNSGTYVFCDIIDVNLQDVVVNITAGDLVLIPRHGRLEMNTIAAEKAIERQRRALDSINYDRAASSRLKAIIIDPASARIPHAVQLSTVGGGPFDPEKKDILARALGLQDVLAIQGPPGTGKTRLIEEILVQYLKRHPRHRVLLSSQTHVALDNVIDRIRVREPSLDVVRIGRLDDQKISASCRELILDRKAQIWSEGVRKKAHSFLNQWAANRGIDRSSIEIGMHVERLLLLIQQERMLAASLINADKRVRDVNNEAEVHLSETGSASSATIGSASVEAQQVAGTIRNSLNRMRSEIADIRQSLLDIGGYGAELSTEIDESQLRDWSSILLDANDDAQEFRELLEMQEEWLLRVGRSSDFHAAMLASAQIVAGTCIGMASVRGMNDIVYDLCIVDEASKATATEILVPMSRSRKWVLVGDPAQLPPFFESDAITHMADFDENEVKETLLDRFLTGLPDSSKALLTNQHRMVKPIGDLISEVFYGGQLKSPKVKPDVSFPGALPKCVTWLTTSEIPECGEERIGKSFRNEVECKAIRDLLQNLDFIARKRRAVYEVALIAGYVAQVKALQDAIRDRIHEWEGLRVVCSTVDAFQGSEAEICIYSVTRSNTKGQLGFLSEKPRLNVALSRGRSALIIVGDDVFCQSVEGLNPFRKVIDYIDRNPEGCERRAYK